MRAQPSFLSAMVTILLVSPCLLIADDSGLRIPVSFESTLDDPVADPPPDVLVPPALEPGDVVDDVVAYDQRDYGAPYLEIEDVLFPPTMAVRFGVWGVSNSGSQAGTGEWQGLDSVSPFWDIDGIRSNGYETLDFSATGTENQSTAGDLYFYGGPQFSADIDYDRFLHRLGHDQLIQPLGGFYNPPLDGAEPGAPMYAEDFNPGQDYAIRVQRLDASFKGRINENLRWRLNVWGMKKEGFRQANSTQHCFNQTPAPGTRTCHVVSQAQRIDWMTMEVEPVIEARFGWLTAEYSRTMRSFQQDDQVVLNNFNSIRPTYGLQSIGAYAVVPENYTEIDRIKLHAQLGPVNEMYVIGHVGNTHNKFRESDRKFWGVDARLTNTAIDGLSLTAYGKTFTQNNSPDTMSLNARYPGSAGLFLEQDAAGNPLPPQTFHVTRDGGLDHNPYISLVDRQTYSLGLKGRWRPFRDYCGTIQTVAVTGGYDYSYLQRGNQVDYFVRAIDPVTFMQPSTINNTFFVGLQQDWNNQLRSFIRYKMIDSDYPLVGVTPRQTLSLDAAINSNLPERQDRVEFGGTWNPADNFLLTGSVWLQNTYNHSALVNFDEDSYPMMLSAWYAANEQWSFSAGAATFSNWISQDITLGREDGIGRDELAAFTSNWRYTGRSDVFNLGTTYMHSPDLTFTGGLEYVRGANFFAAPPSPATAMPDYSDLPGYSQVRVNTYRATAGIDYRLSSNMNSYFRYNYFDYDDKSTPYNAGTAHMFLGGVSGVY